MKSYEDRIVFDFNDDGCIAKSEYKKPLSYTNGYQRVEQDERYMYSWLYMDGYGSFDRISKGQAYYLIQALDMYLS